MASAVALYNKPRTPQSGVVLVAVQHIEDPTLPPLALKLGLSLVAAALGATLLTAMIRVTRSFLSAAADRPGWARKQQHLAFSAGTQAMLSVNLVLPGIAAMVWVGYRAHLANRPAVLWH